MTRSIRILSVDDHLMSRDGLASVQATQPDRKLDAEASNGYNAFSSSGARAGL